MLLVWNAGVRDSIGDIAETGSDAARLEVIKITAFLKYLENKPTVDHWNVYGAASGRLTVGSTRHDGETVWRLHETHRHCAVLLVREGASIRVLAVCNRTNIVEIEASFCVRATR